jgi:hypothetical protein
MQFKIRIKQGDFMAFADKENLARHNGQPLLNEHGMVVIDSLLAAHTAYEEAEKMHVTRLQELQMQIDTLTAEKQQLTADRGQAVSNMGNARHGHSYGVKKATERNIKGNNEIYAAVIQAVAEEQQGGLWYPNALAAADEMGRSFVDFDQTLRSAHSSQPAMVVETANNGWTNLFLARTKQLGGVKPTTVPINDWYGGRRVAQNRGALEIPVKQGSKSVFQIYPGSFGREEHLEDYAREPSEYSNIQDGFKLILPGRGIFWSAKTVGEYDTKDGTAELKGGFGWGKDSRVIIAVGNLSVARELVVLQNRFAETVDDPARQERQLPLFEQLGHRALGKSLAEVKQSLEPLPA